MGTTHYTQLRPFAYQAISATSSTAVGITTTAFAASAASATFTTPQNALIVCETAAIRWRDDGTAAANTTSGGMPLAVGQYLEYDGDLRQLSFISQAGTCRIHVSLYRVY